MLGISYRHVRLYRKRWHVAVVLFVIALPFAYLYAFSQAAHLDAGEMGADMAVSLYRIAVAYVVAAGLGWSLAVLFHRGKRAVIALPVFDVLQSVPTFAALPLAVTFIGSNDLTVIIFLVLAIIWPIFFSVVSALKLMRQDWQDAVRIADLHGWNYIRLFIWPASLAGLATGTVVGLGEGWEALIATEIIVRVRTGLGVFFGAHTDSPRLVLMGMFGLLLVVFALNKLLWLPFLERSHQQLEE